MDRKHFKIIKKYYEYVVTKWKVLINQRHFRSKGVCVKYMYKKREDADILAIVFSACTRPGLGARYNYVKTLDGIRCNRLYILDDFGEDKRGSYYLGTMPEFKDQQATMALIQETIDRTKPKKVLFCGSCKGGYAALNFGIRFEDAIIIMGEPTYRIASEFRLAAALTHYWYGEETEEKIRYMDYYLTNELEQKVKNSAKIYFFYSDRDEYYEQHTKPLLSDLHRFGYQVTEEQSEFEKHADLSLYFPEYLKRTVEEFLH